MFSNFGWPTKEQWKRIALNAFLAFLTGFTGQLMLVGSSVNDPSVVLQYDFIVSTIVGAGTAGLFAVYKFILALFEAPQVKQK